MSLWEEYYYKGKSLFLHIYFIILIYFYYHFDKKKIMTTIGYHIIPRKKIELIHKERFEYIQKMNERGQGVIIMMNHYSGIDILFLFEFLNFYTVVKSDLLTEIVNENESWLFSYLRDEFLDRIDLLPYKRGDKESGVIVKDHIAKVTKEGKNVVLFPEGTTQHCFKKPLSFKKGIFELAYEKNIPIFSMSINYSQDIGFCRGEPFDVVHILKQEAKMKIYCNGIFFPIQYSSMEELHEDVYESIAENVLLNTF